MKKRLAVILTFALFLFAPKACCAAEDFSGVTVRLAQQYGMQYAPAYVMQKAGLLEKYLPGATLEWTNLGGGSAMNEALLSGRLDVAFMGVPPFLIAMDRGADYRIASGVCAQPMELMIAGEGVNSLGDITPEIKIAMPSIGSIQHICLAMACKNQLGDAKALENSYVAMANPDAYAALLSGTDIRGHLASMPYIDLEARAGMKSLFSARDGYDGTTIVCVTTRAFNEDAALREALCKALSEAVELVNGAGEELIAIVAETENISAEDAARYLSWPGTRYSTSVDGTQALSDFMLEAGYTKNPVADMAQACWSGVSVND